MATARRSPRLNKTSIPSNSAITSGSETGFLGRSAQRLSATTGNRGLAASRATGSSTRGAKKREERTQQLDQRIEDGSDEMLIRGVPLQRWILLALASGGAAALTGAFAKLTTTSLTSSLSASLASSLSLNPSSFLPRLVELGLRGFFFLLNIGCNALMWALFTRALTAHSSATKVSLVNTTANFLSTAVLGWMIFAERFNGMWLVGAVMMIGGNLVVGYGRDESGDEGKVRLDGDAGTAARGVAAEGVERARGEEDVPLMEVDEDGEGQLPSREGELLVGDEDGIEEDRAGRVK